MDHKMCIEHIRNKSINENYFMNSSNVNSSTYEHNDQPDIHYPISKGLWKDLEILDYFKLFVYLVLIVGGLLGNVSVILTVALNKFMRTTINIYVANLAVSDAIICTFCVSVRAVYESTDYIFDILGQFICKFDAVVRITCQVCSVLTLAAISCDRFMAVMFPFRTRTAKHRTSLVLVIIWVLAISVSVPLATVISPGIKIEDKTIKHICSLEWPVYWNYDEATDKCVHTESSASTIYFAVLRTTLYFVPVGIMISTYSLILWRLHANDIFGKQHETNVNAHSRSRKKVNKMVVFVLVAFIICRTPRETLFLYIYCKIKMDELTNVPEWFPTVIWVSFFLLYTDSFINPFIYGWFNKTFREGLCAVLRCGCTKSRIGIPVRIIRTFSTHVTSMRSRKASKLMNCANKIPQEPDMEMKLIHPAVNENVSKSVEVGCITSEDTKHSNISVKRNSENCC